MTGLYTRSGLDQMYSVVPDSADSIASSVIYLDIDHRHVANELHGFEFGNELIVRVADLLSAPRLPDGALAARISADRFAIVLPGVTSVDAMPVAGALQKAAAQLTIGPAKDAFEVSVSCGVSVLLPIPEGLARAVGQLRSALKADRLLLYAQRIVPLQNPSLGGSYELLLRLQDVDGTLVSPGPLIVAAQCYQLLPSIDRWVVQRALQMLSPYRGMLASRGLGMSINVSGQSIGDETFIQQFAQHLGEARWSPA